MSTFERNVKGLLGTKLGMTQVWDENNRVVPVTVIAANTNVITQIRHPETDGYNAIQVGFGEVDGRKVTKPQAGHFGKAGVTPRRHVVERHRGHLDEAEAHFRESLRLVEAVGAAGRHIALSNVAMVLVDRGALVEAHALLTQALVLSRAAHHVTASSMIQLALLVCEAEAGDFSRWHSHFAALSALRDGILMTADVAWHARRIARLADAAGERACAAAAWELAIAQFEGLGRETEAAAAEEERLASRGAP